MYNMHVGKRKSFQTNNLFNVCNLQYKISLLKNLKAQDAAEKCRVKITKKKIGDNLTRFGDIFGKK